jgi:terminase small subunit / prophage DNA-packing protein
MKTREVTLDKLATILGKSRHYVLDRLRAGMPFLEKGGRGKSYILDQDKATVWCAEYDANMDRTRAPDTSDARRRHTEAVAQLKELQLQERLGSLVPLADVRMVWEEQCVKLRTRLLQMAARLAGPIVLMTTAAEIERAIDQEVREVLTELSGGAEGTG